MIQKRRGINISREYKRMVYQTIIERYFPEMPE